MASFDGVADSLDEIADARADAALREMAAGIRRLKSGIAAALGQKKEWLYDDLALAEAEVRAALEASGLTKVLTEFDEAAAEMAKATHGLPGLKLGPVDASRLQSALDAKFTGWQSTVDDQVIAWVKNKLVGQTISPISTLDLADQLAAYMDDTLTHLAETYITTAMQAQVRQTWGVVAENLGVERYVYRGPDDKITRPFCQEHLNQVYTREEIDALDNEQGLDVFEAGGGWNCRHKWIPVVGKGD